MPTSPTDHPDDLPEMVILFEYRTKAEADAIQDEFHDAELRQPESFGGTLLLALVSKPVVSLFQKLARLLSSNLGKGVHTKIRIGPKEISLDGYTAEQVEHLIESPALLKLLKEVKKK